MLTLVDPSSIEYKDVYYRFIEKLSLWPSSCKIERIVNRALYESYQLYKSQLTEKNKGFHNEMIFYHGTNQDSISEITSKGFNRSLSGIKNETVYGKGVYFAKDSSCFNSNTAPCGPKQVIQARVLVGESVIGDKNMITPPNRAVGVPYDSTCNHDRSIFVVYHDNQCYPEYLITYTVDNHNQMVY